MLKRINKRVSTGDKSPPTRRSAALPVVRLFEEKGDNAAPRQLATQRPFEIEVTIQNVETHHRGESLSLRHASRQVQLGRDGIVGRMRRDHRRRKTDVVDGEKVILLAKCPRVRERRSIVAPLRCHDLYWHKRGGGLPEGQSGHQQPRKAS